MELRDTKSREKLLAVITAAILAAVFIFTAVIEPQLKRHRQISGELAQLQLDLTKAKGNLMVKDRIEKIYSQIEPLIVAEGTEQQQISGFTRLLDQIYSKLNVKIMSVKILPIADENYYRRLSIRIEMAGHIEDFLKFIEAIEEHPEPIRIEQFDLTAEESKDSVRVSMIISKIVSGT
jgi:Tfp pilus assembly protein PilO